MAIAEVYIFSTDAVDWVHVQELDKDSKAICARVAAKFTGDPATETALDEKTVVTEEKRLSYLISSVDFDCSVVPRGAFILNSEHRVIPNSYFSGKLSTKYFNYSRTSFRRKRKTDTLLPSSWAWKTAPKNSVRKRRFSGIHRLFGSSPRGHPFGLLDINQRQSHQHSYCSQFTLARILRLPCRWHQHVRIRLLWKRRTKLQLGIYVINTCIWLEWKKFTRKIFFII